MYIEGLNTDDKFSLSSQNFFSVRAFLKSIFGHFFCPFSNFKILFAFEI
jgi:hypothetical protein